MQQLVFIIINNSTCFGHIYVLFGASEFDVSVTVHHIYISKEDVPT